MVERRWGLTKDAVTATTVAPNSVGDEELIDSSIKKVKLNPASIQFGSASVSLGFAAAGVETVTASVTFPTAFAAAPSVVIISSSNSDMSIGVSAITASGFTVAATDTGTDYTTAQTVTIYWMAVE